MFKKTNRQKVRQKKHLKIRKKITGTAERPRICVFKSLTNISVQIVDDVAGKTLVSASTNGKDIRSEIENGGNAIAAKQIGKLIATKAVEKGITTVVFDRSGYLYTGRLKALADSARENGLKF